MDKIECIEDYFNGIRAYYLFFLGQFNNDLDLMVYIINKDNLNSAKVAFLSNIMLGIKEDLVENKGSLVYKSKIFLDALENSVSHIATKVEDGYRIGNYVFPDVGTLVAMIRNKLAHGKYVIDYDKGRVIMNHKGVDIPVSINKLAGFVVSSFSKTIFDNKTKKYERDLVFYRKPKSSKGKRLTDLSQIRSVIKGYNYVKFTVEALNGLNISKECENIFEDFLLYFKKNPYITLKDEVYVKTKELLKLGNCNLSVEYKGLTERKDIQAILDYADGFILNDSEIDYNTQISLIGSEVQRRINGKYNHFNAIGANVRNLMLLDAISKTNSIKSEDISFYLDSINCELCMKYDEFGAVQIAMFNSLFVYPFDDIYTEVGGYKIDRSSEFDFSKLDLSMVDSIVLNIEKTSLDEAEAKCNKLLNKQTELSQILTRQQDNLSKVSGDAALRIEKNINDIKKALSELISEYAIVSQEYNNIRDDYDNNELYFKNKAIIEGIRNSIAHGQYEIIPAGEYKDTIIIFNDIYGGKLTFQLKIKFSHFERLILDNIKPIFKFIYGKTGLLSSGDQFRR